MVGTSRAEVVRRVGAGAVALAALVAAGRLYDTAAMVRAGDGLRAMLGEGSGPTPGDTLWLMLAGGLPALILTLGLVPATALVLAAASRSDRPSSRTRRVLIGLVAAGIVLVAVGLLGATSDPTSLSMAMESWFFAVGSPRALASVWLVIVAAGVSTASVGVLLRRRGPVLSGAVLVTVGALASALAAGASTGVAVWTARNYRGGLPLLDAVLVDGKAALALVAATAVVVGAWCTVAAWRRLTSWALAPADASPAALAERTRRRRIVAAGTAGAVAVVLAVTVAVRVASRESARDVLADPALAACVEGSLGADGSRGIAPDEFDEVYVLDCPWSGDGARIASLAGIERLGSVHDIDLSGHDVADLGPLASLTGLTSLRLTGNTAVADLSGLAGLPLTNLGLSDTGVVDLQPLARTRTLQFVGLARTAVSDLSPLAGSAGLIELDVAYASVSDLSPLAGASALSKLDVRDNRVADVTPLATMTALDELWIGGNPVTDLRPLLDAPALLGVDVEGLDLRTPGIDELREQGVYVGGFA